MAVTASVQPESGRYGQRAARMGPLRPAYSQNGAVTASVQPEWGRTVLICRIRLPAAVSAPFFQRRHGPHCAKPTRIQSGWPGQGLVKHTWSGSKPVCMQESAGPVSGRTQPAPYQFPTFRLGFVLPQTSRIILCKTSPDPI